MLLYGGDLKTVAVFKEMMGGQPNPLEAVETVMHFTDYEYGEGITVVLPPEAANAPEITLPRQGKKAHRSKSSGMKSVAPGLFKGRGLIIFRLFSYPSLIFNSSVLQTGIRVVD